jgi:hypothetical protein
LGFLVLDFVLGFAEEHPPATAMITPSHARRRIDPGPSLIVDSPPRRRRCESYHDRHAAGIAAGGASAIPTPPGFAYTRRT